MQRRFAPAPRGLPLVQRGFPPVQSEPSFDHRPRLPHITRGGKTRVPIVSGLLRRLEHEIKPCLPNQELLLGGALLLLEADSGRIEQIQTSLGINLNLDAARELIQKRQESMIFEAYLRALCDLLAPVFQLIETALPRRLALGFTNEQHGFFHKSFDAIPGDELSGYYYRKGGSKLCVNIMALANPLGFGDDPPMCPRSLELDCFGTEIGRMGRIFSSFDPTQVKSVRVSFTKFDLSPIPWGNFGGLHSLRLPCCFIDAEALPPLCDVLKGCKDTLKSLDISGNFIFSVPEGPSEHEKFFSVLGDCAILEKLNLDDNGGISAGFFERGLVQDLLGALRKLEKLRTLKLAYFISTEIKSSSNLQIFSDLIYAIPKSVVDFDYSHNTVWPLDKTHDGKPLAGFKDKIPAWKELLVGLKTLSLKRCVLEHDAWDQLCSFLIGWGGHHLDLSHMRCSDRAKTSLALIMDVFNDSAEHLMEIRKVKVDFTSADIVHDHQRAILATVTRRGLPYLSHFNVSFSNPRPSDGFLRVIQKLRVRHKEAVRCIMALCLAHRESKKRLCDPSVSPTDHPLAMLPQDILGAIQFWSLNSKCDDIRPPTVVTWANPAMDEGGSGSEWAQQQDQVAAGDMDDSQPRGTKRGLAEDTDQHPAATATAESEAEEGEKSDDLEPASKRART